MRKKNGKEIICKICKKEYYVRPSVFKKTKYLCSRKCVDIDKSNKVKENSKCVICNKKIEYQHSNGKQRRSLGVTCSPECLVIFYKKDLISHYKYGKKSLSITPLEVFFRTKINRIKTRCKKEGINFNLSYQDLVAQYNRQNGLCYYSGIPMSLVSKKNRANDAQLDLELLSVDRKNSSLGYEPENIVLCCIALNIMKGKADLLYFYSILNFLVSKQSNTCHIKVKKLYDNSKIPERAKIGDAGYDLFASTVEDLGDRIKVGTGICIQPAAGWYCEVYSRSSNTKKNIMLMNSVGIIDNGYIGEIICVFYKTHIDATINVGDKIAQLIPKRYVMADIEVVDDLEETARGSGGFGSTGQ